MVNNLVLAFTLSTTVAERIHLDLEVKISLIMCSIYFCSGIKTILGKKAKTLFLNEL